MLIALINTTPKSLSYVNGQIVVPANGQLSVSESSQITLSSDPNLLSDISLGNIVVNDGIGNYAPSSGINLINNISDSRSQIDSDGAVLSRTKVAPSGWTFQLRSFEVTTATLGGSLFNSDANNVPLADATVTLYDDKGNIINDPASASQSCVQTVVDLVPPYDFYLVSGRVRMLIPPNSNVRVSVIGAPDIPYPLGGSRVFVQNVNFAFIGATDELNADGRAAKFLQYNAQLNTNKLRFIINHTAGTQVLVGFFLDHYKE